MEKFFQRKESNARWQHALTTHLSWWLEKVRSLGEDQKLLVAPEFGPAPYMTHDPRSGAPLADLWEVNEAMRSIAQEAFQSVTGPH